MKMQAGLNHQFIGMMPEHGPDIMEALVARKRPELYQLFKEEGISFRGNDFMDGFNNRKFNSKEQVH